jgi:predicted RNA-binding Zn ribbon-like protein
MRLSRKYPVPREFALLYEFLNSLDLRHFQEHGAPHKSGDEFATMETLTFWLRDRKLLDPACRLTAAEHRKILNLRESLRAWLQIAPSGRSKAVDAAHRLSEAASSYPLVIGVSKSAAIDLQPFEHVPSSGIAKVVAQLQLASATGRLERLKMCASEECQWIYFDRSKPASRRWCSPLLCGNRAKTRAYRRRRKGTGGLEHE